MDEESPQARLALLLKHFSELDDDREAWRIVYPIEEVLLLVTCATIASCDDFEDIVEWGEHHVDFLRQFSEFHHGIPSARWLRDLSIASIRHYSQAASRAGSPRCGRIGTTSSPSTAKRRAAPMITARGSRLCTR
jgi:hypothetical protein